MEVYSGDPQHECEGMVVYTFIYRDRKVQERVFKCIVFVSFCNLRNFRGQWEREI